MELVYPGLLGFAGPHEAPGSGFFCEYSATGHVTSALVSDTSYRGAPLRSIGQSVTPIGPSS